ncbi:MAG: hypothetical protein L0H53_14315 [Candidatus Nitrosocosmicus sp.]|nr:hypothetical protein [Candidatus Nitrosocosmicus sp.]
MFELGFPGVEKDYLQNTNHPYPSKRRKTVSDTDKPNFIDRFLANH